MLDGSRSLPEVLASGIEPRWTLIFGNEGKLPKQAFFSAIQEA